MDYREIETWRDLKAALDTMTTDELDQPAQLFPPTPDGDATVPLQPLYLIGRLMDTADQPTRSARDNGHHPEAIVLYADFHPFGEDGAIGEDLETGERVFPRQGRGA